MDAKKCNEYQYSSAKRTFMQFETYAFANCYQPLNGMGLPIPSAEVDSVGACADICHAQQQSKSTGGSGLFGLSGRYCICGAPSSTLLTRRSASHCQRVVATAKYNYISPADLTDMHGLENQYYAWYDRNSSNNWKDENNSWSLGMPSLTNVTSTQIVSTTTTNRSTNLMKTVDSDNSAIATIADAVGILYVSEESKALNLGSVSGPNSGEFVVREFDDVVDVNWATSSATSSPSTSLICTNRVSVSGLFGDVESEECTSSYYSSYNPYCNNADYYNDALMQAKLACSSTDFNSENGEDGKNRCVGVVEYPPISPVDVTSFYLCYQYQCPIVMGGVIVSEKVKKERLPSCTKY